MGGQASDYKLAGKTNFALKSERKEEVMLDLLGLLSLGFQEYG